MTEQQIEIALSEHKEKIKELEYSYKTLGTLILVDKKILKFCSIQHLNYFWVKDVLKRFKDKFFIVTELEFLDFINELEDLNKSSSSLIKSKNSNSVTIKNLSLNRFKTSFTQK